MTNKKVLFQKKCGMLVLETLKCKIFDFLNSNMYFCSQLYGNYFESFFPSCLHFLTLLDEQGGNCFINTLFPYYLLFA